MIRYCLLSYILCIRRLSARLRKRFPSCQEIMRTGLMRPDEAARIGDETSGEMYGSNWWLPLKVRKERSNLKLYMNLRTNIVKHSCKISCCSGRLRSVAARIMTA